MFLASGVTFVRCQRPTLLLDPVQLLNQCQPPMGQGKVQLFLEGDDLRPVALVLGAELFVSGLLF